MMAEKGKKKKNETRSVIRYNTLTMKQAENHQKTTSTSLQSPEPVQESWDCLTVSVTNLKEETNVGLEYQQTIRTN